MSTPDPTIPVLLITVIAVAAFLAATAGAHVAGALWPAPQGGVR